MIDEKKLEEMKYFAEHLDDDVLGVTIPGSQMAEIADTALKLWRVVRAAERVLNRATRIRNGEVKTGAVGAADYDIQVLEEPLAALEEGK